MPDNANDLAPEQKAQEQTGTSGQSASSPAPTPLTREQLEEALGGVVEKFAKQYDGLRQVVDKRVGRLERERQQQVLNQIQAPQNAYGEQQEQTGYNIGSEKDRRLARVAVREAFPDFDFESVNKRLNDPDVAPQYLALEADGRTFDWTTMYENAWKDERAERASAILAEQQKKEQEAAAQREQQKAHAVISGSTASYPENVKVPQTRPEAQQLSDKELVEAMLADGSITEDRLTPSMKELLKG